MVDLVFNRVVNLSRATISTDPLQGSRMVEVEYSNGVAATIQPKRDRNISGQNFPTAVSSESVDAMTTWKIILKSFVSSVRKGDIVTDDDGVKYAVEIAYRNPFGFYLEGRIMTP
jgi:hypothetical protein